MRGLAELIGWEPSRTDRVLGHPATLDFPAEDVACARCGSSATVYKTTRRTVVTLAQGRIEAREIQRICRGHPEPQVQRSRVLAELVPRGQRYGYDLITRVGCLRFLELCQRREIRARLSIRHGIELSEGTISALSDRFLLHLGALHRDRVAALRQGMRGGYPLHIDGTHYQGSGGLFLCYNGWRGWVLHAGRIDSERIEEIEPIVEQTVSWFGRPVAVVRDQSSACGAAVAFLTDVGVPDLLCHYHVLKNLGKRLLHRAYRRLVALWRVHKGSSTLRALLRRLERADDPAAREVAAAVYWILEGEGKTPPCFPFATPLAGRIERLLSVPQHLGAFASARTRLACKADLDELGELVHAVEAHGELQELLQRLHARKRLFDEARAVFRLADPSNPPDPLLPDIQLLQYRDIEDRVDLWRRDLRRRLLPAKGDLRKAIEAVLEPLDTMHHHLFGHPSLSAPDGRVLHVVERTNNALEHLFSHQAQDLRRRTGRKNLGRDLEELPAEAALVHNLRDPLYVKLLAGSLADLPRAFATTQPDAHPLRNRRHGLSKRRVASLRHKLPQHNPANQPTAPTTITATES